MGPSEKKLSQIINHGVVDTPTPASCLKCKSDSSSSNPNHILPIVELNRKYLLIPKLLYFTLYMAYFTCYTFKAKFFKDVLGFSPSEYGFISSGLFVVVWVGSMMWNYVADATSRMKLVVMGASLGMALSFESFLLLSLIQDDMAKRVMSIVINICYTLFYSSLLPLMDAQVVAYLKSIPGSGKELFGRQRLWGSFGYGFVTFAVGAAVDASKKKNATREDLVKQYMPMFYISAITVAIFMSLFYLLVPHDNPAAERARREQEAIQNVQVSDSGNSGAAGIGLNKWGQMKALLLNPRYLFLLVITLLVGYGRQNLSLLLSIYTEEHIAGKDHPNGKIFVSIAALCGLVFEVIIFFFGKPLLAKMGSYWLLVTSLLTIVLRLWAYYLIPENNPTWIYFVFCVELLKGMSSGTLQVAAVQMASDIAGPDLQATAQGIYKGVYDGFAGIVSAIGGSLILQYFGFKATFLFSASLTSTALLLVFILPLVMKKKKNN